MASRATSIIQRVVAGVFGRCALATAFSICFSFVLPTSRADAVLFGLLISFAVYAAAILCNSGVRSTLRMRVSLSMLISSFGSLAILLNFAGPS